MARCKATARKNTGNKVASKSDGSKGARKRRPTNNRRRVRTRSGRAWRTIRNIYRQQKLTSLSITRGPFSRVVRELANKQKQDVRWTKDALEALHCISESFLIQVFEDANLVAIHGKRITVMPRDFHLLKKLQPHRFGYEHDF